MEIVGSIFFDLNWEFNFLYKLATKVNKNVILSKYISTRTRNETISIYIF